MTRSGPPIRSCLPFVALVSVLTVPIRAQEMPDRPAPDDSAKLRAFVAQYCVECHNREDQTAGLALDTLGASDVNEHAAAWEKVVRKLRRRQMPPVTAERPSERSYQTVLAMLEGTLDKAAADRPNPGRTETFRRLSRIEYQNAIRDLLAVDIDASTLLPPDESLHGFDNLTLGDFSPSSLDRYIAAAQKISQIAVGGTHRSPGGDTIRIRADITQEDHVEGLPLGTRGGALIPYHFPQDGEYDIQIRLARDRNEEVEGLTEPHEVELLMDRMLIQRFTVEPPPGRKNFEVVDEKLKARIAVSAGPHDIGITFVKKPSSLLETKRQPYQAHFNMHRHPRISPAVYQVSITGPYDAKPAQDSPSRRRILAAVPLDAQDEEACARRILTTLMRRAYRQPVNDADLEKPMQLFREGMRAGDFDSGIELALSSILVNPRFLFRVEHDPGGIAPQTAYRLSGLELASRLSFFLWSSIPDDELLDLAVSGELENPDVFRRQARRMLADPKSKMLATNFAGQWLQLRNLESITPDARLFPDFDDNLRQALRRETELLFETVVQDDRSVLELLRPNHTYLNERLAKHYGIPYVYGNRFRRVELSDASLRGGLLRQGSILTITSYANRTSPVIRGKWILENLMGDPPPPPPATVPPLKDNTVSANLSVRERLAEHRTNPACASCHNIMDPVGFALENFDAVGRYRLVEEGKPIDASGGFPGGRTFTGVDGLEQALLDQPDAFAGTLVEKLLTFALGRNMEYYDEPAIRQIVRDARANDYRFSSLVVGAAMSTPFQMRRSE
jgi:mono/diheme cytochrome c family protein